MIIRGKKVYLSGPMTGIEEYNRPAFNTMAVAFRDMGAIAINPARHPIGLTYEQYMEYAMLDIKNSDCVACLEGWKGSPGARREVAAAKKLGKPIYQMKEYC